MYYAYPDWIEGIIKPANVAIDVHLYLRTTLARAPAKLVFILPRMQNFASSKWWVASWVREVCRLKKGQLWSICCARAKSPTSCRPSVWWPLRVWRKERDGVASDERCGRSPRRRCPRCWLHAIWWEMHAWSRSRVATFHVPYDICYLVLPARSK
jgi:hypothetical protein